MSSKLVVTLLIALVLTACGADPKPTSSPATQADSLEVGPQGPQGAPGQAGSVGPAGPQGAQGPKGDQGVPGTPGATAEKGDPGDPGAIGPMGLTGPQGAQGIQGIQGIPGVPGAIGPKGPAGPAIDTTLVYGVDTSTNVDDQTRCFPNGSNVTVCQAWCRAGDLLLGGSQAYEGNGFGTVEPVNAGLPFVRSVATNRQGFVAQWRVNPVNPPSSVTYHAFAWCLEITQ